MRTCNMFQLALRRDCARRSLTLDLPTLTSSQVGDDSDASTTTRVTQSRVTTSRPHLTCVRVTHLHHGRIRWHPGIPFPVDHPFPILNPQSSSPFPVERTHLRMDPDPSRTPVNPPAHPFTIPIMRLMIPIQYPSPMVMTS